MINFHASLIAAALSATAFAGSAQASVVTANLEVFQSGGPASIGSILGVVTLTDFVGYVQVDVNLNDASGSLSEVRFINTGGPHTPFVFNLTSAAAAVATVSNISPAVFAVGAAGLSATPYGAFTDSLDLPEIDNGASHAVAGPLDFRINGITTADFALNSLGYYFGADVVGPDGSSTGSVAANTLITTAVPEPSTWALMILGFAGVGFMAYRRKLKPTLIAA